MKSPYVLVLSGSLNINSRARVLARYFESCLQAQGIATEFWCLRERPLPFMLPETFGTAPDSPDERIRTFARTVTDAVGLVLATPVYHGGTSGVLKNALDHLPAHLVARKPCVLLSHGGSVRSGVLGCESLRGTVRALGGEAIPVQISTGPEDYQESSDGVTKGFALVATDVKARVQAALAEFQLKIADPRR